MIALLRGINVGGRHCIAMAALRELLEGMGLKNVRTLLQSGNVVFEARAANPARLARRIEDALEAAYGFRPAVILRTHEELREVVARNPFAGRTNVPGNKLLVTFLADLPKKLEITVAPEEMHIVGREMYVYFPDGMGRSKFPFVAIEKKLGTPGTARNWNTVLKLLQMAP